MSKLVGAMIALVGLVILIPSLVVLLSTTSAWIEYGANWLAEQPENFGGFFISLIGTVGGSALMIIGYEKY